MREKNLSRERMAELLGVSSVMLDKIMCGDVIPSRHLEKQMVEVLGISRRTLSYMSARREKKERECYEKERVKGKAA
jgi:transcriptional regulator with XRE-family HTH domain